VLDRGLVRFGKFIGAVFGVFLIVGAYLWGLDMKETEKNLKDFQKKSQSIKDMISKDKAAVDDLKKDIIKINADAKTASEQAVSATQEIQRRAESTRSQFDFVLVKIREEITKNFDEVLTQDQYAKLLVKLRGSNPSVAANTGDQYSSEEVLKLVQTDVATAVKYFKKFGIDMTEPPVKIKEDSYQNAYWDGHDIVYGLAMANGPNFGPYTSTVVFHEMTHTLFSIPLDGQSGAVEESIPDVVSVLIAEDVDKNAPWTIGSVRNGQGAAQALRSLSSPGTAYDNVVLGKDPQVDHMSRINTDSGNSGIFINNGILNKAAYLMTEGGDFHGVHIERGIGPDKLAKIYMAVIKKLKTRAKSKVDFLSFKTLVISTAGEELDTSDQRVVADAFRAVGL